MVKEYVYLLTRHTNRATHGPLSSLTLVSDDTPLLLLLLLLNSRKLLSTAKYFQFCNHLQKHHSLARRRCWRFSSSWGSWSCLGVCGGWEHWGRSGAWCWGWSPALQHHLTTDHSCEQVCQTLFVGAKLWTPMNKHSQTKLLMISRLRRIRHKETPGVKLTNLDQLTGRGGWVRCNSELLHPTT